MADGSKLLRRTAGRVLQAEPPAAPFAPLLPEQQARAAAAVLDSASRRSIWGRERPQRKGEGQWEGRTRGRGRGGGLGGRGAEDSEAA